MSWEIPTNIERDIQQFADQEHITREEAVVRLIETGLSLNQPQPKNVSEQPATPKILRPFRRPGLIWCWRIGATLRRDARVAEEWLCLMS